MQEKFPFESDFVDSYLNYFILKNYKPSNSNTDENLDDMTKSAEAFNKCVSLHKKSILLSDCAGLRDNVNSYVEANAYVNLLKGIAKENCAEELINAHNINYGIHRELSESPYNMNLLRTKYPDAEKTLRDCIFKVHMEGSKE